MILGKMNRSLSEQVLARVKEGSPEGEIHGSLRKGGR